MQKHILEREMEVWQIIEEQKRMELLATQGGGASCWGDTPWGYGECEWGRGYGEAFAEGEYWE